MRSEVEQLAAQADQLAAVRAHVVTVAEVSRFLPRGELLPHGVARNEDELVAETLGVVRVSVPDNWREVSEQGSVWFAPNGGYGSNNGQAVFTHGVNIGIAQTNSRNLQQATNDFLNTLQQGSPNLRSRSGYQRTYVGGRNGLSISLSNTNEATGRPEVVNVATTQSRNGELLYIITVAPESDYNNYQSTFQNILRSVQLND